MSEEVVWIVLREDREDGGVWAFVYGDTATARLAHGAGVAWEELPRGGVFYGADEHWYYRLYDSDVKRSGDLVLRATELVRFVGGVQTAGMDPDAIVDLVAMKVGRPERTESRSTVRGRAAKP